MIRQNKIILVVALCFLNFSLIFSPNIALADDETTCNYGRILPSCVCDGDCNINDFVLMFIRLADFFLGIVALVALYFIIMGAFTLIVAGGNPEKIKAGKNTLVSALVGLFVVFAAWVIINSLYYALTGGQGVNFINSWWQLPSEIKP